MSVPAAFLTARWEDLALVTWRVPAAMLLSYLPPGLEPDRLPDDPDDVAYVSFVAFRFLDTKVKGIAVPLHTDFPEVNLRAYVRERDGGRRGVTFIAELVPKHAIAMVANLVYHEHYRTVPMHCEVVDELDVRRLHMRIELGGRSHALSIEGDRATIVPPPDSREAFFKEHEWGFGRDGRGELVVYRVHHPIWAVYPTDASRLSLAVDFAELYGEPWGYLDQVPPYHVAYAVGSEIAVYPRDS
ncbi:MAG: DUF2071 domain-containing protein [Deltaproteobacteria bacterium]|nr:DUF2071 domain-containing protein [Deltaproteobacteria bacterium]